MGRLLNLSGLALGLFVFFGITNLAPAQIVDVGGPLIPGYGRPPLRLNIHPLRGGGNQATTPLGYNPVQIQDAYGFTSLYGSNCSGICGQNQTIAIVDAYGDGNLQSDVSAFNTKWGLPQFNIAGGSTLTVVTQVGTRATNSGWALETALDVEWAHAIAPQANILLVVAKTSSLSNLLSMVQYAVSKNPAVVSMSWGSSEFSSETTYDSPSYFGAPGVTFVASSGDSGELNSGVEWPAASPYVVSVGGTTLSLNLSTNTKSETAWSGGGGGISLYEGIPSFQSGWQPFTSGGKRTVPDVSYVADPNTGVAVYCSAYGGWVEVGGTSVGAPQWSALIALVNQSHGSIGPTNPALYYAAQKGTLSYSINGSYFTDIISGSDGNDADDSAVTGYDYVTGLGTPVASALVPTL